MKALSGRTLKDAAGNVWTVNWFAVVPNDGSPTGVGPAVELERAGTKVHIPVECDGDAADFERRVTGASKLPGTPSKPYTDAIARLR